MIDGTITDQQLPSYWVAHDAVKSQPELHKRWKKNLAHVGAVLLADESGRPSENQLRWASHELEAFVESIGGRGKFIFRASLFVVNSIAPLLVLRLGSIRWLSFERTETALERFERSPLGMMLFAVQTLLCIVYFEHPQSAAEIGFDGQCMGQSSSPASSAMTSRGE